MAEFPFLIFAGAFAGGLVSGLTGFGTGITALPFWLAATTPVLAAPLVVVCSLVGQFQTLPAIWHAIDFKRARPFIIGGLLGVPLGTLLLPYVPASAFRAGVGAVLVIYCSFFLIGQPSFHVKWGGRIADGAIGLGGGVMGGMAGLSGPFPTIWTGLKGWSKDARRGVLQAYNLAVLLLAFITQGIAGLMTSELGYLFLVALPGTIAGAWLGQRLYNRLNDWRFNNIVLVLLLFAGISLLVSAVR
ncbi:MAG: sulfite exporter TauE/SafE family protein [Burkholderiales bacterium]